MPHGLWTIYRAITTSHMIQMVFFMTMCILNSICQSKNFDWVPWVEKGTKVSLKPHPRSVSNPTINLIHLKPLQSTCSPTVHVDLTPPWDYNPITLTHTHTLVRDGSTSWLILIKVTVQPTQNLAPSVHQHYPPGETEINRSQMSWFDLTQFSISWQLMGLQGLD